ncbi:ABC transporter permease [candidate division KSB1 bacterium]|nr:ABC transporter permease [candidate division KSB1 bacterium]RQW06112.1 MAG: ABC transporter permease [candidate division KSB1 bacterium]
MWILLKKDLLRLIKQPAGFLFLIAVPIVLSSLMGLIFANSEHGVILPHIALVIEDHDDSLLSGLLKNAFHQEELGEMFDVTEVDKDQGRAYIEQDKAAALLIIPAGFSDSLLALTPTELILVKNPSLDFGPKIVEEMVHILAEAADRIVRIGEEPITTIRNELENNERMTDATMAAIAVMINQLMTKTGSLIFDPPITLNKQSVSENESNNSNKSLFASTLCGIATMCLFFILNGLAVDYFREREHYTMYRILVSPTSSFDYILSKYVYLFFAGLISFLAVWSLAFFVWRIPIPLSQVLPFCLMLVIITSSSVGIISLIYSLVRSRSQAAAIIPALIIVFALLGGAMIPIQALPPFFERLSIFSPIYWGVDGLQKILLDQQGLTMLASHIMILILLSIACPTLSLLLQRRRILR